MRRAPHQHHHKQKLGRAADDYPVHEFVRTAHKIGTIFRNCPIKQSPLCLACARPRAAGPSVVRPSFRNDYRGDVWSRSCILPRAAVNHPAQQMVREPRVPQAHGVHGLELAGSLFVQLREPFGADRRCEQIDKVRGTLPVVRVGELQAGAEPAASGEQVVEVDGSSSIPPRPPAWARRLRGRRGRL